MRRIYHHQELIAVVALLLITTALYASSLNFGFIWDDPLWYGRVVGAPISELIRPMPDYHFYRPVLVLYNRLFLQSNQAFSVSLLHAAQVGWHLLHVALVYALFYRLGLEKWMAAAAALLVALYPFSYQAVAWAAPAQPMAAALQTGAWLAFVLSRRRQGRKYLLAALSLLLFITAIFILEGIAALAGLPLLLEWILRRQGIQRAGWRLVLAYPVIVAAFGLLWIQLPRQSGFTLLSLDPRVALYLLQGFVFPWLGRPGGYALNQLPAEGWLWALVALTLSGLLLAAQRNGSGRLALFGLAWAFMGIAPAAVGLEYNYVSFSPRLLYPSSPGIALLWVLALLPPMKGSPTRRWWRSAGVVLLVLITVQSGLLLTGFQGMFAAGAAHLNELIKASPLEEADLLIVNFPDRYTPKRPPYPIGYWGMTLAPVSVKLGAFPAITAARFPHTISMSMPWIDEQARAAGPYQIDLRGVIVTPDQLYQSARQVDGVYLSQHLSDGTFALLWVGAINKVRTRVDSEAMDCGVARFGQTVCLQAAEVDRSNGRLDLSLTWLSVSVAPPHETIFTHMSRAEDSQSLVAQADGDGWLGMVPLSIWQPGDTIQERRVISLPEPLPSGHYVIRLGVYNRLSGERLFATTPQGEPLPDNAFVIDYVP